MKISKQAEFLYRKSLPALISAFYSNLQVDENGVTFTLTNTGETNGAEVAQLYVGLPEAKVFRPAKELKGFKKVFLKAGESKAVQIPFDDKTFRYWNVNTNSWEIEAGNYGIMVGPVLPILN